jgi:hypothetical protein
MARFLVVLALLGFIANNVEGAEIAAPHVRLSYEGIAESQARSIVDTIAEAWEILHEEFGMPLPDVIKVTVSAGKVKTKLSCGGESIVLELKSSSDLDPPQRSRVFNLYGMCHELGHIAWTFNMRGLVIFDWDGNEGWAHYIGSVVVDRLYELKGPSLWYVPYDYRADGTARLKLNLSQTQPAAIDRAAGCFLELENIVGRRGIAKLFTPLWEVTHTLSSGLAPAIEKVLVTTFAPQAEPLKAWWSRSANLLLSRHNHEAAW